MKINQGCWRSTGKKNHNKHNHSIDPGPVSGWIDKKLIDHWRSCRFVGIFDVKSVLFFCAKTRIPWTFNQKKHEIVFGEIFFVFSFEKLEKSTGKIHQTLTSLWRYHRVRMSTWKKKGFGSRFTTLQISGSPVFFLKATGASA